MMTPRTPLDICIVTCDIVGPIRNGGIGTAYYSMARTLADAGHRVTVLYALGDYCEGLRDGKDALNKLTGQKVHLVISDVNMPNMDGLTFVKTMKQNAAYKFTPVIMLTTEAGDAMKAKGQEAGAKAWVVKPFQPPQMLAAVSKLVMP